MVTVATGARRVLKPTTVDELPGRARERHRNGYDLPSAVDGRSSLAKRFKQLASQILVDQQGDCLSEVRLQLIRRFVGCCVLAEQLEHKVMLEEHVDLNEYATLISSLVRVANKIGIDRIPKNLTPDLRSYLEQKKVNGNGRHDDYEVEE